MIPIEYRNELARWVSFVFLKYTNHPTDAYTQCLNGGYV
jgi:hypothetical protein